MADFKYIGEPTAGKSTKDIKLPKSDGTFAVFENVEPNVSTISTIEEGCLSYMQNNNNFEQQ